MLSDFISLKNSSICHLKEYHLSNSSVVAPTALLMSTFCTFTPLGIIERNRFAVALGSALLS